MTPPGPVVIELGVLGPHLDDDRYPGSGGRPRADPWLVVLLILVCCGAGVTAAAQPAAAARLVFSASGVVDSPQVTDDAVLATVDGSGGTEITSYELGSGRVRWQYRPPRRMLALPAGESVIVAPVSCSIRSSFLTTGLDAATGDRRWERRGAPIWLVEDAPLVVIKQPVRGCSEATVGFDPLPSAPFTWLGVDLATGDVRWELKIPAAVGLTAGTGPSGRATWLAVSEGNAITTYDLRTGAVAGRYEPPQSTSTTPLRRILGAGDQLLTVTRNRGTLEVSAYQAPDLRPRWSRVIAPPTAAGRIDTDGFFASWCGPSLCVGPATETIGLDPATGLERWRLPGRPTRTGPAFGLFVRSPPVVDVPVFVVHDLATGDELATLPDTELLSRTPATGPLLNSPGQNGRLWRLDLADGELRALTVLPGEFADCDTGGRYLACRSSDGELRVWRLPAGGAASVARGGAG